MAGKPIGNPEKTDNNQQIEPFEADLNVTGEASADGEALEILDNMPPVTAPSAEADTKKPKKKQSKPRLKAHDSRAANAFGAAFDELMSQLGIAGEAKAKDAASGFTVECLDLCENEKTAQMARLALTGVALAMVIAIPVSKVLQNRGKPIINQPVSQPETGVGLG